MKTSVLKITAILLMVAGGFSACNNSEPEDVLTGHFFVSVGTNDGQPSECGYLLFTDTGNPGHFHNRFVWSQNLPKEYQVDGLQITVTFRYVERGNCNFPVINIISIRKR